MKNLEKLRSIILNHNRYVSVSGGKRRTSSDVWLKDLGVQPMLAS